MGSVPVDPLDPEVTPDPVAPLDLQEALAGRYRIQRLLGAGASADVYLADDLRHGRLVALKVLRREVGEVLGPQRFLLEIETVARLSHPHILPLHDSGEAAGLLYFVMPFVEGESLRDRLMRETVLPLEEAHRIVREVADALAFAHERHVIHRDIKPENILLLAGHAVLTDFGIARGLRRDPESRLTSSGFRLGTPVYMSPEAFCDDDIDGRADLYSLGVVLYEMIVGTPPFGGRTLFSVLTQKSSGGFDRASERRSDLPRSMDAVVERALAPDPADRYADAHEFLAELERAGRTGAATPAPVEEPAERRVAVLPFAADSGGTDITYLSDGLTDELIHALSRVPGLRVVARTSVFALRDAGLDAPSIGRRLQADVLLEGSVRSHGDRLRVMLMAVNAADGLELWSERWDRTVGDVFALQDEIADAASRKLATSLGPATPARRRAGSGEAYEQYLRGRHLWNQRTAASLARSVACFDAALAIDPGMSIAVAGKASALATQALYGLVSPMPTVQQALDTADEALGNAESRAEALAVRACLRALHQREWAGAEKDFLVASAANPRDPVPPHWYAANLLLPLGRLEEAGKQLHRARELDPLSPTINATIGVRLLIAGEAEAGINCLQDILSYAGGFSMVHYFLGLGWLAAGDPGRATPAMEKAVELTGEAPETISALLAVRAAAGGAAEAGALFDRMSAIARERYVSPTLFAQAFAALGRMDEAFESVERAIGEGALDAPWIRVRPTFRPLWNDPRFPEVARRLGLSTPGDRPQ